MIIKAIKYIKSLIRIVVIKIKNGRNVKIQFDIKNLKSIYIGKNVKIKVNKGSQIKFGKNVYISDYCNFECDKGKIIVGNNTYFNESCKIVSMEKIYIGSDCLFGPNVSVYDHDHKFDDNKTLINKPIYSTQHKRLYHSPRCFQR